MKRQILGWREGAGDSEHDGLGQQRPQENLDERRIEDGERRRLWSGHDRVAQAILRAKVVTRSSRGRRDRGRQEHGAGGEHRGEKI